MSSILASLSKPIIYLITSGATGSKTTPDSEDFKKILTLVEKAVEAEISLVQIREKALTTRVLYKLTDRAADIVRGSSTRLLVNDRYDVAVAAGAHGVHLTSQSLPASVIRSMCPADFVIGTSTHSVAEAKAAHSAGADFILFGPVFQTESKRVFGEPQGLAKLAAVVDSVPGFPVIAVGGIRIDNITQCVRNGAAGIAAIKLLNDEDNLVSTVNKIRQTTMTTND
jgi:thiamine-phosphate diphosphorylase